MDDIEDYFLNEPGRLRTLGRMLMRTGAILLLAGAVGRYLTASTSILAAHVRSIEPLTLDLMFPAFPTFWIPETAPAAFLAFMLVAVGVWLDAVGRKYERILRWT